ncbi:MAG TPA: translation initiation factor [Polyangiaceae bacterium LLY-WYZ-15_(1-7)]|nr:translation initiation factor [Sandaracinus sp.]HJL05680.1 translation initiation factor [Polyangiaceae bacterium LLY-WYZ-15_(1-7)]MBJ69999.1 translation initiation factor [Sandaracinus sp.]HJL08068.1 translation initiation factor [Polyangiaceae bacterium LLY-WYZ-15_(1-7)]HJL26950.1 translation initiation factor [Polyangiaceae bacterium LLY-WYZ-15_(1-7)]
MAKKKKAEKSEGAAPDASGELVHNPFAALTGGAPEAKLASAEPEAPAEPEGDAAPGELRFSEKVVLRRETKGRGGKTVTRVSGLPASHREALAKRMKKALGCGAKVEGEDVILLGSVVDRAADWLADEGAKRVVRGN